MALGFILGPDFICFFVKRSGAALRVNLVKKDLVALEISVFIIVLDKGTDSA